MNSFLNKSRNALTSAKGKVTIVVGNESCDLDSMTSSILFAWFRTHQAPEKSSSNTYIPLLNISRQDICLRPEFKALFRHCNISEDNLVTLTDLTEARNLAAEQTQWVLVDHNKLEGELGSMYSERVLGCIDHHDEENVIPRESKLEPRIVEKCGSCTSLVLRELAAKLIREPKSLTDEPPYTTDALKLGLTSILIDTNNLQDQDKVKKVDIDFATAIDETLRSRDSTWKRDELFDEISTAKRNLDGLPLLDVLRKDYKQWTEGSIKLGMSSVVKDLQFLFDKDNKGTANNKQATSWNEASSKFMDDRELSIWAIMTAYLEKIEGGEEVFQRQLMVHWRDERSAKIVESFTQRYDTDLKLELQEDRFEISARGERWRIWHQGNTAASRKQVGPMLRTVIKQSSKL